MPTVFHKLKICGNKLVSTCRAHCACCEARAVVGRRGGRRRNFVQTEKGSNAEYADAQWAVVWCVVWAWPWPSRGVTSNWTSSRVHAAVTHRRGLQSLSRLYRTYASLSHPYATFKRSVHQILRNSNSTNRAHIWCNYRISRVTVFLISLFDDENYCDHKFMFTGGSKIFTLNIFESYRQY